MPGVALGALPVPVGVFGKLPGRGDFLARDLDPAFTDVWHAWLARELPQARRQLADRFLPAYLQAPIWRFALRGGVAGPEAVTGVMIPSLDAVDREFPLTLATHGSLAAPGWYEAVEELALAALAEDWQAESWLTALAALAPSEAAETPGSSVRFWSDGSPFVAPGTLVFATLPAGADFQRLLVDSP